MLRLAGQLQGLHMKDAAASSVSFSPCSSSSRRFQPPPKNKTVHRAHQRRRRQVVAPRGQPHHRPLQAGRRCREERLGLGRQGHHRRRAGGRRHCPLGRRRPRPDPGSDQGGPRALRGLDGEEGRVALSRAPPPGRALLRKEEKWVDGRGGAAAVEGASLFFLLAAPPLPSPPTAAANS